VGLAAHSDKHPVDLDRVLRAVLLEGELHLPRRSLALDLGTARQSVGVYDHSVLLEPDFQRPAEFAVHDCEDTVESFDNCDLCPELGQRAAQFEPDVAAAYDGDALGQAIEIERTCRRENELLVARHERQVDVTRTGRNDDVLGLDADRAVRGLNIAALRSLKGRPSLDQLGTGALQQTLHALVQALHDIVLPRH